MDEYAVLVDGVVRDALGLDGARGAGDAPAEALTAPAPWGRYEDGSPMPPPSRRCGEVACEEVAWEVQCSHEAAGDAHWWLPAAE